MTDASDTSAANYLGATALVDELVRGGVGDFVVCPGSRSTPLALAIARQAGARLWLHLDERSGSYFGLGLAKAKRAPVALVATSGTAAANFLPAVVEAFHARVPLIVLTADRPHELRDCGAPQTIDQLRIYGGQVKWFFDLAEPATTVPWIRHLRAVAGRAIGTARRGPAGPVHLNCPFREPLIPRSIPFPPGADGRDDGQPYVTVSAEPRAPEAGVMARLGAELAGRRGLILCGPSDDPTLPEAVARLAQRLGFPILADPLSGVRCGAHDRSNVIDSYDAFLRDEVFVTSHAPEVILRFGAMPTSKPVLLYLHRHASARLIVIDDDGWNEPTQLAMEMLQAGGAACCAALQAALPNTDASNSPWLMSWCDANRRAREAMEDQLSASDELFEGRVFAELAELLPDRATLYVGNSMPVRDLDTFFPSSGRRVRFLANRGANGIDGVVSSALGASAANAGPVVLAIGDLSFYHDSNGLFAARKHGLSLTIILLNNNGGGIFSFLPQATDPEHFEALFGTPHGLDLGMIAAAYGARVQRVANWDEFRTATRSSIVDGGLRVIEVPTDRHRNVTLHRAFWPVVARAVADGGATGATVAPC